MAKEKAGFLDGAKAEGVDAKVAERVFDLMEKFAGYGFNRSHSAAYGLLTYQTAYLKRYFPVEFFAALLTCDKDDTDAVVKFIAEARANGIAVLRPDVNESDTDFTVGDGGQGRRLSNVTSGQGRRQGRPRRSSASAWARSRASARARSRWSRWRATRAGAFLSLFDFCKRVDGRKVNRKVRRGAGQGGRVRRPGGRRTASSRARMFARDRRRVSERAAAGAARARERPDQPAGAVRGRGRQHRPGRASARTSIRRRRRVDAQGAARLREGGARLLHQRPPAGSLRGRDPPLHHRHLRQLHGEGRARRGDPRGRDQRLHGAAR